MHDGIGPGLASKSHEPAQITTGKSLVVVARASIEACRRDTMDRSGYFAQ